MRYIIASHKAVLRDGWKPASANIIDGHVILNENELRYRYPEKSLEDSAPIVDGIIVNRTTALDFISARKTLDEIRNEIL